MINSSPAYRDATHTYRRIGKTITMIPIGGGTPCEITYDSEPIARDRMGWLVRIGRMTKAPAGGATPRGQGKTYGNSIAQAGG